MRLTLGGGGGLGRTLAEAEQIRIFGPKSDLTGFMTKMDQNRTLWIEFDQNGILRPNSASGVQID